MKYTFLLHGSREENMMSFTRLNERSSGIIIPESLGYVAARTVCRPQVVPQGLFIPQPGRYADTPPDEHLRLMEAACSQDDHQSLFELVEASCTVWKQLLGHADILAGQSQAHLFPDGDHGFIATNDERDAIYTIATYTTELLAGSSIGQHNTPQPTAPGYV